MISGTVFYLSLKHRPTPNKVLEHPHWWSHNFQLFATQKDALFILTPHFITLPTSMVLYLLAIHLNILFYSSSLSLYSLPLSQRSQPHKPARIHKHINDHKPHNHNPSPQPKSTTTTITTTNPQRPTPKTNHRHHHTTNPQDPHPKSTNTTTTSTKPA